jgi:hypothetical protein
MWETYGFSGRHLQRILHHFCKSVRYQFRRGDGSPFCNTFAKVSDINFVGESGLSFAKQDDKNIEFGILQYIEMVRL